MDRARYGAFLVLSLVFISITFLHPYPFRSKPPEADINNRVSPPPALSPKDPSVKIPAAPASTLPGFPIDLNKASKEELMLLPAIGPRTAERIIEKRLETGGFSSVDELTAVKSIGKVRLEKIRKYAVVRPVVSGQNNAAPAR